MCLPDHIRSLRTLSRLLCSHTKHLSGALVYTGASVLWFHRLVASWAKIGSQVRLEISVACSTDHTQALSCSSTTMRCTRNPRQSTSLSFFHLMTSLLL